MSMAMQFADCSSNNPMPNMKTYAKAGHQWLERKVTEGTGYTWFQGATVAQQAHARGVKVLHYHWLRPDSPATAQADYFAAAVKQTLTPGDALMCDYEATAGVSDGTDTSRAAALAMFMARIGQLLPGYYRCVYTGNWYLAGKPAMQAECRKWDVIMSDYSGVATLPNPYGLRYVAWQFTDKATVPGFGAPLDYNRWLIEPNEPLDLMEWIMTLPGAPKGLTYQQLIHDVQAAAGRGVWQNKQYRNERGELAEANEFMTTDHARLIRVEKVLASLAALVKAKK